MIDQGGGGTRGGGNRSWSRCSPRQSVVRLFFVVVCARDCEGFFLMILQAQKYWRETHHWTPYRWRHPVASSEALDALHRAMRQDRHGWAFRDNSGNGRRGRHPHLPRLTDVPPLSVGGVVPRKYRQGDQVGPIRRSRGDDVCDARDDNDRCDRASFPPIVGLPSRGTGGSRGGTTSSSQRRW